MFDEFFELLIADDARAFRLFSREVGVYVVQRGVGGANHDRRRKNVLPGKIGAVEFVLDVPLDGFGFLFGGEDPVDEFAVKIDEPEREVLHLLLALFGKIAYLDGFAAQIDEDGAFVRTEIDVGDIVAVRLGRGVDDVDGEPRLLPYAGVHFLEIFDMAQRRRRNEITPFHAEVDARFFELVQAIDEFFDATLGELPPLEIVYEADGFAFFEQDLRFVLVRRRNDERKAARTHIDHRIFHIPLLQMAIFIFMRDRRTIYRSPAQNAPFRPRDRRICISPRYRRAR